METMTPAKVSRIARAAARRVSPQLHVVRVTFNPGSSDYVEILLEIHGCHTDSCHIVVGVFRNVPEETLESEIAAQLGRHAHDFGQPDERRE